MEKIESLEALRELMGNPIPMTEKKIFSELFDDARAFISRSPLVFMGTADSAGQPTVSPKGDQPGFVHIADDQTLFIPERPGNKLLHGLSNIVDNGHIGLIFIVPGTEETLRINGRCGIYRDSTLSQQMAANGKPALLLLKVEIEECFFHCAKAFKRSHTWQPEQWAERMKISFGKQVASQTTKNKLAQKALEKTIDQAVKADYKINL